MKYPSVWLFLAVAAATFACSIFVGGPAFPEPTATSDATGTPADLESVVQGALTQSAGNGAITLELTEDQLTAYAAQQLAADGSTFLSDPRVYLRDGAIQLIAKMQSGPIEGTASVTAHVVADSDGHPQIQIIEADLGPVPMSDSLKEGLSSFLQESLTGSLGPSATGFRLETISIGNGIMTITGRLK
jgi:hypothetical protein